jgi:hypothetical protein
MITRTAAGLGQILLWCPCPINSEGIFIGTNFKNIMRNRGITTLVFMGIASEIGIESIRVLRIT